MRGATPVGPGMGLHEGEYVVATLHRPSNVDDPATLRTLVEALLRLGRERPVLFPVHPRARARPRCGRCVRHRRR